MSAEALVTFGILGVTIALFVSDRFRLDVVAMAALLALALTGVASLDVALSGFSNPAVLMIAGLFVVGAAISETGIADWLGQRLERLAGHGERRVIVVVMLATAVTSAFMSSTGTVAILLPVVGTLALRRGIAPSHLLMPLAFAAHLGSNLTLISTPPNLLVSDALRDAGHEPFRFFSFSVPGLVVLVAGVAYVALLGRRLLPVRGGPPASVRFFTDRDLAADYEIESALCSARVGEKSSLVGRTLAQANLRAAHGVTVVAILHDGQAKRVLPARAFEIGDELRVLGDPEAIERLSSDFGVELLSGPAAFSLPPEESLAEVVLPRRSHLTGRTLRVSRFRDRYRATVLAVRRLEGERRVCYPQSALRDLVLRPGDTLLLKGRRKYVQSLQEHRDDLVLLALPDAAPGIIDQKLALAAAAITLVMLVVMAFGWLPNVVAVLLAALALVLAGCVRPTHVYRAINWESVVLIACMIPLATSLQTTGGTSFIVASLEGVLAGAAPTVILALLVALTSAMGMVLSNTATAVLLAPVAIQVGAAFGIAPQPLLMGVAFGASAAFATPIASPVNVLVMTPGQYRFVDYVRVGLPLQLLVLALAVLVIPIVWPF